MAKRKLKVMKAYASKFNSEKLVYAPRSNKNDILKEFKIKPKRIKIKRKKKGK